MSAHAVPFCRRFATYVKGVVCSSDLRPRLSPVVASQLSRLTAIPPCVRGYRMSLLRN